jgi:hypothetical protein
MQMKLYNERLSQLMRESYKLWTKEMNNNKERHLVMTKKYLKHTVASYMNTMLFFTGNNFSQG